ncbi:hypothetical protein BKA93DRAFT_301590 [Sparassis latifolia]
MYYAPLHARSGSGGGSKLPTSTIVIIVVVCVAVLALVLVMFLWRILFRACRRDKPTPLPPVQPLAHHREQQLAAFAGWNNSRPTTFFEYDNLHAGMSSRHLLHTGSATSLLPGSVALSSNSSFTEDAGFGLSSPEPTDHLPCPNPSSGVDDNQDSNLGGSFSSSRFVEAIPPSPSIVFSETSSSISHSTSTSTHLLAPRSGSVPSPSRLGRSSSSPRSLSRRVSVASSLATSHTTHSRVSTIHGAPHSIHSNIHIIMPAPLAPRSYPYASSHNSHALNMAHGDQSERRSVFVDQWIPIGTRSSSVGSMTQHSGMSSSGTSSTFADPEQAVSVHFCCSRVSPSTLTAPNRRGLFSAT